MATEKELVELFADVDARVEAEKQIYAACVALGIHGARLDAIVRIVKSNEQTEN